MDLQAARQIMSSEQRVERLERNEIPAGFTLADAFPSSPVTNDRVIRTDRSNTPYFYDGTYWLTMQEYQVIWSDIRAFAPYAATTNPIMQGNWRLAYDTYVTSISARYQVQTTNNNTNYWTVTINSRDYSGTDTVLLTIDTHSPLLTAGTNYRLDTAVDTALTTTGTGATAPLTCSVVATKTLTPGTLILAVTVNYRLRG